MLSRKHSPPPIFPHPPSALCPPMIGITGQSGSGKDTIAAILWMYGYQRFTFAYPLKQAIHEVFGFTWEQLDHYEKEVVDPYWNMSPREIMQRFGTGMRRIFGEDIWIRSLIRRRMGSILHAVIPDVCFNNEAEFIKSQRGLVWKVTRPNVEPARLHISEEGIDDRLIDAVIENDGTIEELKRKILALEPSLEGAELKRL